MSGVHEEAWARKAVLKERDMERRRKERKEYSLHPKRRPLWMFDIVYGRDRSGLAQSKRVIRAGATEDEARGRVGVGDAWLGGAPAKIVPLSYVCTECLYGVCECQKVER
jgi:hypothetical protein